MKFDPRTKLCLSLEVIIAILLTQRVLILGVLLISLMCVIAALRAVPQWLRTVRLLAPMLILLTMFSAIEGARSDALTPALKLLALGTASAALFAAVPVDVLGDTFTLLRLPPSFSFVLIGALRYAPAMAAQWTDLIDARRARGVSIPRGIRALPAYASLLVPAIIRALRTADDMAEAMESRGFGAGEATLMGIYRLHRSDWACIALSLVLLLFSLTRLR